jgi:protein SCO1/2
MRAWALVALLFLVLPGCGEKSGAPVEQFQATDITGAAFGRDFHLTDPDGHPRSLSDFRGKVVVLFFGYTHCPDVCPTTLGDLALVMRRLGADASRVQVLFVTLDPERDTPALLAQYVPSFYPSFLGLFGDAAATARVAKEFRVFYRKVDVGSHAGYFLDHSAGMYVFDRAGRLRLFVNYGLGTDAVVHDLKALLR